MPLATCRPTLRPHGEMPDMIENSVASETASSRLSWKRQGEFNWRPIIRREGRYCFYERGMIRVSKHTNAEKRGRDAIRRGVVLFRTIQSGKCFERVEGTAYFEAAVFAPALRISHAKKKRDFGHGLVCTGSPC